MRKWGESMTFGNFARTAKKPQESKLGAGSKLFYILAGIVICVSLLMGFVNWATTETVLQQQSNYLRMINGALWAILFVIIGNSIKN